MNADFEIVEIYSPTQMPPEVVIPEQLLSAVPGKFRDLFGKFQAVY